MDARLLLFQTDPRATYPYSQLNQVTLRPNYASLLSQARLSTSGIPGLSLSGNPAQLRAGSPPVQSQDEFMSAKSVDARVSGQENSYVNSVGEVAYLQREEDSPASATDDDDVSEFLMSVLALSGRASSQRKRTFKKRPV